MKVSVIGAGNVGATAAQRIAEKELFLTDQILSARAAGTSEEAESLAKQLSIDVRRLLEDCEAKKEKLRASFGTLGRLTEPPAFAAGKTRTGD